MEKILILGGTSFIGRNLVEKLILNDDFEITLYNRGKTNTHLFPDIPKLKGERNADDILKISTEEWDYVIDLSCYYPESLEVVLDSINSNIKRYIFISTCSVYDSANGAILKHESSPVVDCTAEQRIDKSISTYGNRKAECERILMNSTVPYSILRPSLVYGRYDPTDRFYYWLYQVKNSEELLIPEEGKRLLSITYVDDLVHTIIQLINPRTESDVYNIVSIPQVSILQTIEASNEILDKNPRCINASVDILNSENVSQWAGIPLWLNSDSFTFSNSKSIKELDFRASEYKSSVRETISYYEQEDWYKPSSGISEIERKLLLTKILNQNS